MQMSKFFRLLEGNMRWLINILNGTRRHQFKEIHCTWLEEKLTNKKQKKLYKNTTKLKMGNFHLPQSTNK